MQALEGADLGVAGGEGPDRASGRLTQRVKLR